MNGKSIRTLRNFFVIIFLLLGPLALVSTASNPPQGGLAHASTAEVADPLPYFLVTWSATARGSSDTNIGDSRFVKSRDISYSGSTVIRQWANGGQDNYPLQLTVNDNYDEVETSPCNPGTSRYHTTWSIVDPERYTGGPIYGASAIPLQRPDGTWFMFDPVKGLEYNRFFGYKLTSDDIHCGGDRYEGSLTTDLGSYASIFLPGAGDLEGDADGKVFSKTTQFDVIGEPPITVQWTVTARRLEGRDLTVDHLEVTQGLQDGTNTVPLVRGRRTVVRAYVHTGTDPGPVPGVTGKLTAYSGETSLGSVNPFNPGGRIDAQDWPDWREIDDTLNFELPYAWTLQPALRLEVEVNPGRTVVEINYNNNKLDALVETLPSDGIKIGYTPIDYAPPAGFVPENPSANIVKGQEFLRKIYPIPDKQLKYYPTGKVYLRANVNDAGVDMALLQSLNELLLVSSAPRPDLIYGWMPASSYNNNGLGYTPGTAAFGNDTESPNRWRRTLAHEIGHNQGLPHSAQTTAGAHWFDVYDRVIKPVPASVGGSDLLDIMQPDRLEPEAWISVENYLYLVTKMSSFGGGAASASVQPATVGDNLLVTGLINNSTPATASLSPMLRLTSVPTYTLPEGTQYCVTLKNGSRNPAGKS